MKVLNFTFRGKYYKVNEQGHINANGIGHYSPDWTFLGGSRHHWRNTTDITTEMAFIHPESLNGCLGWDRDHGTVRQWGGSYAGRLPRISNAYVTEEKGEPKT
jgi:hypothetical protein